MSHLTNTSYPLAFFEGKITKIEDAKVSIMTNALQYGTGIFGGLRGYYNKEEKFLSIFRIDDHVKRFLSSLKILGVSMNYSAQDLKEIIIDLAHKNKPTVNTYFRPFGYASSLNISPNLDRDSIFEFALYMLPLGDYLPTDHGISVAVSSWTRVSDNAIPSRGKFSGSYINSALAKKEATNNGHDEAIFLSQSGAVAEGSAMNIFIVRDGILITPSKTQAILEGITRRSILEFAKDLGIPVEEREINRTELYIADEAFFTGTGAQISWISKIDHRTVGNGEIGPITSKLRDLFFRVVHGKENKYASWCTKIQY